MHEGQAQLREIVHAEGVGGIILLDPVLGVLKLVEHAAGVVHEEVDSGHALLDFFEDPGQLLLLPHLSQDQVHLLAFRFFQQLLERSLASFLAPADQVDIGVFESCELGGFIADSAIGTCDDDIFSFKIAFKGRKLFVVFGEVSVSFNHELEGS